MQNTSLKFHFDANFSDISNLLLRCQQGPLRLYAVLLRQHHGHHHQLLQLREPSAVG